MKWVTRENAAVDRIACPWLIRKFVDPAAEFVFVPADEVGRCVRDDGAIPFDVPDVELGHVDGRCSFESILRKYRLGGDPALAIVARIVHGADITGDGRGAPESAGLRAIAEGFRRMLGTDDARKLELEFPIYNALYAWARSSAGPEAHTSTAGSGHPGRDRPPKGT